MSASYEQSGCKPVISKTIVLTHFSNKEIIYLHSLKFMIKNEICYIHKKEKDLLP